MPIYDFVKKCEAAKVWFYASKNISDINKEYVRKFVSACEGRGLSPNRISIVLKQLPYVLTRTPDIKIDMQSQDKINKIFADVRAYKMPSKNKTFSKSTIETILNVTLVFVKWLNEGTKPKG
jgi:hypothetical protein